MEAGTRAAGEEGRSTRKETNSRMQDGREGKRGSERARGSEHRARTKTAIRVDRAGEGQTWEGREVV